MFYAESHEILEYWKLVTKRYGLRKYICFNHKCLEATWNESRSKWKVKTAKTGTGANELIEDDADVFITGTVLLNEWKWPDIPGLHDFGGRLLHTANWDEALDLTDQNVAVIGAGSSGIQVVPAIAHKVKRLDHYVRGKTWISSQLSEDMLKLRTTTGAANFAYTTVQQNAWRSNPAAYLIYRRLLESRLQGSWEITQKDSLRHQQARSVYEKNMIERLITRPDVMDILIPEFPPYCKRLTPGPGYLEALIMKHVTVVPQPIRRVDTAGIVTQDNIHRPVDILICATGFQTRSSAGFPIYGQDSINLRVKQAVRPKTYLGLCTDNFPNFFQSLGPNSFQGSGSLLIQIEYAHRYMAKILQRMAYGNVKAVQPKRKHVENFTRYCEEYFKNTVFSADCVSWYKSTEPCSEVPELQKERVTALWPGSSLHALRVLKDVRWDDFNMETLEENEFAWFGDGSTVADKNVVENGDDLSWYLQMTQLADVSFPAAPSTATSEEVALQEDVAESTKIMVENLEESNEPAVERLSPLLANTGNDSNKIEDPGMSGVSHKKTEVLAVRAVASVGCDVRESSMVAETETVNETMAKSEAASLLTHGLQHPDSTTVCEGAVEVLPQN